MLPSPGNRRTSASWINEDSHQNLIWPLPLHTPPGPQQWASLEHKAWIKREAGQGPVAALGTAMGGKEAVALLIVPCCSWVGLRSVFPEQPLVFLKQLLAPHE